MVLDMLGQPLHLDAPPCGSGARRETLFWQNVAQHERTHHAYSTLPTPTTSVVARLARAGITDWSTQPLSVGFNLPPTGQDGYNRAGRPQIALPKFVCYPASYKFRITRGRPGPGLLLHNNTLQEPTADIREALMGFTPGDTAAPTLTEEQRRHLLGQCIDINLLSWLVRTTAPTLPSLNTHHDLQISTPPKLTLNSLKS